jgi:hypothetical protein
MNAYQITMITRYEPNDSTRVAERLFFADKGEADAYWNRHCNRCRIVRQGIGVPQTPGGFEELLTSLLTWAANNICAPRKND